MKEIRIIPKVDARFFEIQYIYEAECIQRNLNTTNALALDLGINNLVTGVSSKGETFIIDGRRLKSINQWFNKENERLQSIKDKQHYGRKTTNRQKTIACKHNNKINDYMNKAARRVIDYCIDHDIGTLVVGYNETKTTNRQKTIACKHNNKINDYMNKAARRVIDYCIDHDIGTLVVGYNETFQKDSNIGKRNNQIFINIPYGKLIDKLKYLCELNDIILVMQEESYTSKASFWDKDVIPVYKSDDTEEYYFSGKRIHRGQYRTASGQVLNADVNGALNILRKSRVVDVNILYSRGEVDTQ